MIRHNIPDSSRTLIVQSLLVVNIMVYFMELYIGNYLLYKFALWPIESTSFEGVNDSRPSFNLIQLVSYSFLHANVLHLLLNMYALWLFGTQIERLWGSKTFLIYYFVCVIGAALVQLWVSSLDNNYYPTIGASGGVFGVLLAFGMFYPREKLMIIFPTIPIQARTFVILYILIELWFGVTGTAQGVAHFAHLGGMLFGFILIQYWKKHPPT